MSKQLTIRGVNQELDVALKQEAERRGTSVNRTVIQLLKEAMGVNGNGVTAVFSRTYHDVDHLAGTWSEVDAVAFEPQLLAQRAIDDELWATGD